MRVSHLGVQRLTATVSQSHLDRLDELQQKRDIDSRSAALRELLDEYEELQQEYEKLNRECENLETKLQRQKREKRQLLEEREERQELVRYVEDERTTEQRWREASLATRLKWKVTGMPPEGE